MSIPFYLASGSPRRQFLLEQVGMKPIVLRPEVPEQKSSKESARQYVGRLAKEKGWAVLPRALELSKKGLIVSADTVVVPSDGQGVLEKPRSKAHAVRMLKSLSGQTHGVITGFQVLYFDSKKTSQTLQVIKTQVRFRELRDAEIRAYVASGVPMDKAGAYGAQEGMGMTFIESIEGSYTNVMGLPIAEVLKVLRQWI